MALLFAPLAVLAIGCQATSKPQSIGVDDELNEPLTLTDDALNAPERVPMASNDEGDVVPAVLVEWLEDGVAVLRYSNPPTDWSLFATENLFISTSTPPRLAYYWSYSTLEADGSPDANSLLASGSCTDPLADASAECPIPIRLRDGEIVIDVSMLDRDSFTIVQLEWQTPPGAELPVARLSWPVVVD